ncbi:MAG TPA: OmpW family outer membrane protein, partial [Thermoanaerobaculia bacterium]
GAGIALVSGELEAEFEDEFGEVTNQVAEFEGAGAILFNAGLNIRINDRWIFAVDVKAIPYSPEIEDEDVPEIPADEVIVIDEVDLNPVIVGFGVRYRF